MQKAIRRIFVFITFLLFFGPVKGQPSGFFTISGFVYEKGSRETLIGVNVYEPRLKIGATTNNYGFYSLRLPADSVEVIFSYVGYQPQVIKTLLRQNTRIDIELEGSIEIEGATISAERFNRISQTTQMSMLEIPIQQARNIPALLGEKDLFKVLQLMPGIQSGTEGTSGFYVRGGGPDQNLIILDDAPVYNASHLFGFFSVFNGDAIKNMQLYKGGFPARFGGRLSSVLDIQMKDGNKEKLAGEAGIGLISSRLTLEGPIVKNKASFLVSGRRTYIDALTRPLMPKETQGGYYFYDLNAKVNYEINQNNRIFLSSYFGRDKFFFRDEWKDPYSSDKLEGGLFWQNATTTLRWNHIFNSQMFANASLIFSDYTFQIYSLDVYKDLIEGTSRAFELKYSSGIQDLGLKYDLHWNPLPNHSIRAGLQTLRHKFTPSALVLKDDDIGLFEQNAEIHYSLESGLYIEDEISFGDFLKINPGIRLSHFYTQNKSYQSLEPRFSSNLSVMPDLAWKFSFASMSQYIHLLSTTGIGLPTDLWVPSTEKIAPQKTWQIATGFAYDYLPKDLEFSIEGYYKRFNGIIGYREGASFLYIDDPENAQSFAWQENITSGEGWAYGLEFLVQRKYGKLSGWVGYTLSWIQHRFDDLNFGKKFWARYDRRHDFSIVGIYEINPRTTFSITWVYATGNTYDLGTGQFPVMGHDYYGYNYGYNIHSWINSANVYGEKNSFRAASYQRLDIGLQFHKETKLFGAPIKRTIELGAYNAYSRKNPFFYFWQDRYFYDGTNQPSETRRLMQVSIFPIVPSISLNLKF